MMSKYKVPDFKRFQYQANPIREAIVEIRFDYNENEDFDSAIPGQFFEAVKERFPEKKTLQVISFAIGASGIISSKQDRKTPQAPVMQTWDLNKGHLLQVGPGIFTANSVKYESWERFSSCFDYGLKAYKEIANPIKVNRVAARYINRIVIEKPDVNLADYFNFGISVPKSIEGSGAFQVIFENQAWQIPDVAKFTIKVRFGTDSQKSEESGLPMILDIDCFTADYHKSFDLVQIKDALDICHKIVGFTFESFLTEKLRLMLGGREK